MVKHIVMLKLKDTDDRIEKLENALQLKKAIETLSYKIDEVKYMEVGLNYNDKSSAYDLVLTSTFDNSEALEVYRTHKEHVKVLDFLNEVTEKTAVVDYEI
ncbi:MAG: Dabb family protein [Bacteroidetes bacterium]|nr:MAG: Dabb family protein [Bacteroidota bacterium]